MTPEQKLDSEIKIEFDQFPLIIADVKQGFRFSVVMDPNRWNEDEGDSDAVCDNKERD